jgi:HEPN domain-containing protein
MTKQEHINYWLATAAHDYDSAQACLEHGEYLWCMHISHIMLEKALKANWVRESNKSVPKLFNLCKIAEGTRLNLSEEQKCFLADLAMFDLEKPEIDYELKAFRLCTKEFTHEQFDKAKELYHLLISPLRSESERSL